ncbi:MAG: phospho-N-acetylmuramoyl-pentapeptide-transferase [Clostridia bacterium]
MKLMLSALTAFAVVWVLGPIVIPLLHRLKLGQVERELGPQSHKKKEGTPTMGGIMMLIGIVVASLIFGLESAEFVMPALLVTAGFGVIGFLDDFIKIKKHRNLGLRAYQKIIGQFAIAILVAVWAYRSPLLGPKLYLPISGGEWDIGVYYIPLVVFTIISEVNAVNLTDGLDGLASSVTMIYTLAMTLACAILATRANQAGELLSGVNLTGMAVFAAAVTGACLGFTRYNTYPARVFMGDTGSLALGGAVSMIAICSRSLLLLPIMGFCFVGSALSVVLQVATNKLNHGKRMFKMAPIHHHFEKLGYPESRIVVMYSLVTAVLCAVCLLSYLR